MKQTRTNWDKNKNIQQEAGSLLVCCESTTQKTETSWIWQGSKMKGTKTDSKMSFKKIRKQDRGQNKQRSNCWQWHQSFILRDSMWTLWASLQTRSTILLSLCTLLEMIELFACPPSTENSMVVCSASLLHKSKILFFSLSQLPCLQN